MSLTGGYIAASSETGDIIGILGDGGSSGRFLYVTSNNATFASLGLTDGTYVWTLGSGADADSLTVDIDGITSAVPEPSAWAVLILGFVASASWRIVVRTAQHLA
jgi:hypothetical protein